MPAVLVLSVNNWYTVSIRAKTSYGKNGGREMSFNGGWVLSKFDGR